MSQQIATTCLECGALGQMQTSNAAIVHKTILCEDCKNKTFDTDQLIGMKLDDGVTKAFDNGYILRVLCFKGNRVIKTQDFLPNRIDVEIKDNIIIDTLSVG